MANLEQPVPPMKPVPAIRVACKRWKVKEVVCDPYRWARSIQLLESSEGLPMVVFPQSSARMTPATSKFYEAVTNGQLTHSGDRQLARHVGNCTLKVDARGQRLSKEHKHSTRRIDLAVAAVMAHDRAGQQRGDYDLLQSIW